jgi:putative Holliday junction resolvase
MYVMGFDYGSKWTGVAIGQTLTATASPLTILPVKNKQIDWVQITALIQEWEPDTFVVGLPKKDDGSDNAITASVRRFSRQLQGRYHLPVIMIDEALTSVAARARFREQGNRLKERRNLDDLAAQIILETWFTECRP